MTNLPILKMLFELEVTKNYQNEKIADCFEWAGLIAKYEYIINPMYIEISIITLLTFNQWTICESVSKTIYLRICGKLKWKQNE